MRITDEQKQSFERDIVLLKESMEILQEMVEEQGIMLNHVESDVCDAKTDIVPAVETIEVASDYSWMHRYVMGGMSVVGIVVAILLF
jgi:t-SNARE complex subunit (syntaxin)